MSEQPVTFGDRLSAWAKMARAKVLIPHERSELGAILLGLGALLIVARLVFEINSGIFLSGPSMSGLAMQPADGLDPQSHAGMIVVSLGIFLLFVGWLAVRPWKRDQNWKSDLPGGHGSSIRGRLPRVQNDPEV